MRLTKRLGRCDGATSRFGVNENGKLVMRAERCRAGGCLMSMAHAAQRLRTALRTSLRGEASNRHKEGALVYPRSSAFTRSLGREPGGTAGVKNTVFGAQFILWCTRALLEAAHSAFHSPTEAERHGVALGPTVGNLQWGTLACRGGAKMSREAPPAGSGRRHHVESGARCRRDLPGSRPSVAARFRQLVSRAAGVDERLCFQGKCSSLLKTDNLI